MEYITSFEALKGFVGEVVEVSFVYSKSHNPNTYYSIHQAIKAGLDKHSAAEIRYRGRLGVTYSGVSKTPRYELNYPQMYKGGVLTDGHESFIWIENQNALKASLMEWIGDGN
jgi:hypothetical protein